MPMYQNISEEVKLVPGSEGARTPVAPGDVFHAKKGLPSCYFKELTKEEENSFIEYKPTKRSKKSKSKKFEEEPDEAMDILTTNEEI